MDVVAAGMDNSAGVPPWMPTVSPVLNAGGTGWHGNPQLGTPSTPRPNGPPSDRRGNGRNGARRENLDSDTCRLCRQRGHWQNQCPQRGAWNQGPEAASDQANVGIVGVTLPKSESYLDTDVNGSTGHCLVDTGCDKSVIPLRFIPRAKLRETSLQLFAANGTEIKVLGAVRFNFRVKGMPLHADLVVSDENIRVYSRV